VPNDGEVVGQDVVVLDFSFSYDTLSKWSHLCKSVVVIDHHKTASHVRDLIDEGLIGGVFDVTLSGAMLTLNYLNYRTDLTEHTKCELEYHRGIVSYVQDADLYTWKLFGSRDVNAGIRLLGFDFNAWDSMLPLTQLKRCGSIVNLYREKLIETHLKQVVLVSGVGDGDDGDDGDGEVVASVYCSSPEIISDLGHEMCLKFACDYAAIHQIKGDCVVTSLRSLGYDVSEIAKKFGGGGHKQAAGYLRRFNK
jgi:oligoribonuclease NrnB/cAMP/cGMP phosphodiesterase (DHH superfamily)